MIPPLQDVRLRSIRAWLSEQMPALPPWEMELCATDLDRQMMEAFEHQETALTNELMRSGLWGTEAGLRMFETERLRLWETVLATHMPPD